MFSLKSICAVCAHHPCRYRKSSGRGEREAQTERAVVRVTPLIDAACSLDLFSPRSTRDIVFCCAVARCCCFCCCSDLFDLFLLRLESQRAHSHFQLLRIDLLAAICTTGTDRADKGQRSAWSHACTALNGRPWFLCRALLCPVLLPSLLCPCLPSSSLTRIEQVERLLDLLFLFLGELCALGSAARGGRLRRRTGLLQTGHEAGDAGVGGERGRGGIGGRGVREGGEKQARRGVALKVFPTAQVFFETASSR